MPASCTSKEISKYIFFIITALLFTGKNVIIWIENILEKMTLREQCSFNFPHDERVILSVPNSRIYGTLKWFSFPIFPWAQSY
jgi:hypothetical protein